MVTANNYMFRPLTGHHQVVHPIKRLGGLYNIQYNSCLMKRDGSYIIYCTVPNPFHWMYNLMMAC